MTTRVCSRSAPCPGTTAVLPPATGFALPAWGFLLQCVSPGLRLLCQRRTRAGRPPCCTQWRCSLPRRGGAFRCGNGPAFLRAVGGHGGGVGCGAMGTSAAATTPVHVWGHTQPCAGDWRTGRPGVHGFLALQSVTSPWPSRAGHGGYLCRRQRQCYTSGLAC